MAADIRILKECRDHYIIQTSLGVSTIPNTDYNLKYKRFGGDRIFHVFDGGRVLVKETYNDGIFNVCVGDKTMQISDAEKLADCITSENTKGVRKIFDEWYSRETSKEAIKSVFHRFPHRVDLEAEEKHIIIDRVFRVNYHGTAYYWTDDGWRFLYIVASEAMRGRLFHLPGYGEVEASDMTMIVIAKIFFLLHPKSSDHIFFRQLPSELKQHVVDLENQYLEMYRIN